MVERHTLWIGRRHDHASASRPKHRVGPKSKCHHRQPTDQRQQSTRIILGSDNRNRHRGDSPHRDGADNKRFAMLAAAIVSRALGAAGYADSIATLPSALPKTGGPSITHVYRQSNTTLVITVAHDGGNDLKVPLLAASGKGFAVMDGGTPGNDGPIVLAMSCQTARCDTPAGGAGDAPAERVRRMPIVLPIRPGINRPRQCGHRQFFPDADAGRMGPRQQSRHKLGPRLPAVGHILRHTPFQHAHLKQATDFPFRPARLGWCPATKSKGNVE